jgi:glycosyltransferase involved in cell wall biosynthesis
MHDPSKTKVPNTPYITMVGRNNRDIGTFCAAVERAGVCGVLITASYMMDRSLSGEVSTVTLLTDRPMEECLNYVEGSFAHLVLVTDGERGAGHISAVSAMLLGKPQIFSDVSPLRDYLFDGVNGIAVPIADVDSVVVAIRRLHDDPALSERLGRNGRDFARQHLSHDASSTRTAEALLALVSGPC